MNSRERMLAAIHHQPVDRIPTDIWATGEVRKKLRQHFGETADINQLLHIDGMAGVDTPYTGPAQEDAPAGENVNQAWGFRYRPVDYGTGIYSEQVFYPLKTAATIDDLEAYRWPRAEWFDYSGMRAAAEEGRKRQVVACGYMAPFYYHNQLRGLEESLMDPMIDPEFTRHLLQRITDVFYETHKRRFEAAAGLIDVTQVTDDFGSQTGPMISLDTFREFYKPHIKRLIDLAHSFGIKVMHHDDGAMRIFLPDLIEMGIDILNPVQWTCPGMEMQALKDDFGRKICFHGGVENQKILPFGSAEEVRAEVRHCIDALGGDGTGYILAPCHNLQAITPVENIIAMYDEAFHYGRKK